MTAVNQKYAELVKKLWSRTKDETLPWRYNQSDKSVAVRIMSQHITIEMGENQNGEPLVFIGILAENGAFIEGFNDEELPATAFDGFTSTYQMMERILETAKRQALGADKALDSILEALDTGVIVDDDEI